MTRPRPGSISCVSCATVEPLDALLTGAADGLVDAEGIPSFRIVFSYARPLGTSHATVPLVTIVSNLSSESPPPHIISRARVAGGVRRAGGLPGAPVDAAAGRGHATGEGDEGERKGGAAVIVIILGLLMATRVPCIGQRRLWPGPWCICNCVCAAACSCACGTSTAGTRIGIPGVAHAQLAMRIACRVTLESGNSSSLSLIIIDFATPSVPTTYTVELTSTQSWNNHARSRGGLMIMSSDVDDDVDVAAVLRPPSLAHGAGRVFRVHHPRRFSQRSYRGSA